MRSPLRPALAVGALALCASCTEKPPALIDEPTWVSAPASADTGTTCADVHGARACWGAGGRVSRVARPVPNGADAWRCAGQRGARVCRRRKGSASPFACDGGRCEQAHSRMPDDGEWECFERAGAVVCRGGEPAAGVVGGRRDEAWICGDAKDAGAPARICVDLAPDRPDDASFDACMMQELGGRARQVCAPKAEPALGARCDADGACPRGAVCADGVCLPARAPAAECWLDAECGAGSACVFATCVRGS